MSTLAACRLCVFDWYHITVGSATPTVQLHEGFGRLLIGINAMLHCWLSTLLFLCCDVGSTLRVQLRCAPSDMLSADDIIIYLSVMLFFQYLAMQLHQLMISNTFCIVWMV
jgi:hypothetical protein